MKRCIITPTYKNHFPFIVKYLESFDKYLLDREFPIYFVVNQSDKEAMEQMAEPYKERLNLSVITFEEVLAFQGIEDAPEMILENIGRLSFQTIKKYFSALYIGAEQFLVLDSESIMIAKTNMNELFDRYFSNPEFFVSKVSDRPGSFRQKFTYGFMTSAAEITNYPVKFWTLESYNWFLELRVLKKMIEKYGDLYEVIKAVKLPGKYHDEGIEGELLYYPYIIYTPGQFGYNVYDTIPELKKYMGFIETLRFKRRFHNSWRAHGGYIEGLLCFVTKKNAKAMEKMISEHCMPIIRISRKIDKEHSCLDLEAQMDVIAHAGVKILASSYTDIYYEKYVKEA